MAGLFLPLPEQAQTLNAMLERKSMSQKGEANLINMNDGAQTQDSLWA